MRPLPSALGALAGAVYAAALSRGLFEAWPAAGAVLATWPGVLLLTAGGALLGAGVGGRLGARWPALFPLLLPALWLAAPEVNVLRAGVLLAGSLALALALAAEGRPWAGRVRPALIVFVGVLAVYLRTLAPSLGEADPFEFQVNVARLGIAHGNGYPLLILAGKVFELLPLGGAPAWRVNVAAAVAGAGGAAGVFIVARRLGARTLPAALAAAVLALVPSVWLRTNEIQSSALDSALLMAALGLGLQLLAPPEARAAWPTRFYALSGIFGLSLTNHLTSAVLAPAVAVAGLGGWWRARRALAGAAGQAPPPGPALARQLALAALALLLGLSVFLYLPLRWPAVGGGEPFTLSKLMFFVLGGEAAAQFDPLLPLKEPQRFGYVFGKIAAELTWAGAALALLGLAALWRTRAHWPAALFLSLALAGHLYFVLAYDPPEPDYSKFFIPVFALSAVFIALGLEAVLNTAHRLPEALRRPAAAAALTAFALVPLAALWRTGPLADLSRGAEREVIGRYTLSQPLAAGAALLADPKRFAGPYYLQAAEGLRPDLDIMVLPDEAAYRAVLDERAAAGQTVYLARYLAGLGAGYSLRSVGPLAEVAPRPFLTPPAIPAPLNAALAGGLELLGYNVESVVPGSRYVTVYWRAPETPLENLAVYLRLQAEDGQAVWQSAGAIPVGGLYPTNAWRAGEYISDFHTIPLAADLPPGRYHLLVGVFPPFAPAETGWVPVTDLAVTPAEARTRTPTPAYPLRARFGAGADALWLLGYDRPAAALPEQPVSVVLYWQRGAAARAVTALGETHALDAWPAGAPAPVRYQLTAPANGAELPLPVAVGAPAVCGWLAAPTAGCPLDPIQITGAALPAEARSFAGQLVLRRAVLETPDVARGDAVRVSLEWQGLQTMAESYTVFVHLVGPDGRLHGQRDYWPVEGTRLTSSWTPGEIIFDPYTVSVPADAPAGAYTVHIGLYLLETLQRLPVLNADGLPLDDKVVLTGLTVR